MSADEARSAAVAAMQRGEWTLPSLVADMGAVLTSQHADVRQRGLRLLTEALSTRAADSLQLRTQQPVDALAAFLTQRMSDERYNRTDLVSCVSQQPLLSRRHPALTRPLRSAPLPCPLAGVQLSARESVVSPRSAAARRAPAVR